jgi:hypothetical protein
MGVSSESLKINSPINRLATVTTQSQAGKGEILDSSSRQGETRNDNHKSNTHFNHFQQLSLNGQL